MLTSAPPSDKGGPPTLEQSSLALLGLPAEIRIRIYEYVTGYPQLMDIDSRGCFDYPVLVAVNRQLRQEFLAVYYRHDELYIGPFATRLAHEHEQNAWDWLRLFGTDVIPRLRNSCIGCFHGVGWGYVNINLGRPSDWDEMREPEEQCLMRDWTECLTLESSNCQVSVSGRFAERTLTYVVDFLKQHLQGKRRFHLTLPEFETLFGEIGRINGRPMSLFPYESKLEDVDTAEFWQLVEGATDG